MNIKFFDDYLRTRLPLYLSGRLSRPERWIVVALLRRSPEARAQLDLLRRLKTELSDDPQTPAPATWPKLAVRGFDRAGPESASAISPTWAAGMALGLLLFLFAWFAIPPAVELEWTVAGTSPREFRVYRAEAVDAEAFELVESIPATSPETSYQYRDYLLLPGREYVYRIEAVGENDVALANDWIRGDASLVLPGQIAVITAGLISLYGLWVYFDRSGGRQKLQHG